MPFTLPTPEEQAIQDFLFPFKAPLPVDPDNVMREKNNPTFEVIPPTTPGELPTVRLGPSAINPFTFFSERAGPRDKGQFPPEMFPPIPFPSVPGVPSQINSINPFIDFLLQLIAPNPGRQMADEVKERRIGQVT